MAAPGAKYVKAYWDDPKLYPTAYEQIAVNPISSQKWQVKIEALAQKNLQSKSSEVWILDISTPEGRVDWSKALMGSDRWELRNDPNRPQGKVAVAYTGKLQSLDVPIEGGELTIKLLRHPWSGKVRVTANNQAREVDLFSANASTEILTFPVTGIGNRGVRNYTFKAVDTPWHRLKFVADGGIVKVEEVKARDRLITAQPNGEFILPFRFWNRFSRAVFATVISFFWTSCLFISAIHLWQGQQDKRFGFWTYAIGLSTTLAGFWTLVFYPGLMTTDSVSQWIAALSLFREIEPVSWSLSSWFPPVMSLLMGSAFKVSREYGLFTFFQLLLFYFSIIILLSRVCSSKILLISMPIILLNPAIWNQSSAVLKDVWTASGLNLVTWSILYFQNFNRRNFSLAFPFLLFFTFCLLLFSFRYNSVTTLPAIVIFIWIFIKKINLKVTLIASCILALSIANIPPEIYGFKKVDTASASIIWEHIGVLKKINNLEVTKKYNLNFIGDTKKAIDEYNCITHDSLIWEANDPLPLGKILAESNRVKDSFRNLVLAYPREFLLNKLCIYKNLLGFNNVVPLYLVGASYPEYGKPYSIVYSPKIRNIGDKSIEVTSSVFNQPFPIFNPWTNLLLLLLIYCILLYLKISVKNFNLLLGMSLSYYVAFFIITPGMNFRYFFPSYVLLIVAIIYGIEKVIDYTKNSSSKYFPNN
jgi:hypothetical protein